jgi:hypothetical protein
MKKISLEKLESLNGGGDFLKGFCGGVGVVRLGATLGILVINPVVAGAVTAVAAGCLAYSLFS